MYKYIILLALFSAAAITHGALHDNFTLGSDWETVTATLYSAENYSHPNMTYYHNNTDFEYVITCIHIQGQIMFKVNVWDDATSTYKLLTVYVPSSATVDPTHSHCAKMIGKPSDYKAPVSPFFESKISLVFYNAFRLDIGFTNSTNIGSAGWLQFAIYQVNVTVNLTQLPDQFPNAKEQRYHAAANGYASRWWKWLGTVSQTSYQCDHKQTVSDGNITFAIQYMQMSALGEGYFTDNSTFQGNMCDFDYEQDDGLAVVIGSVQTGFVLITLVIYLIYLKRRGPVKVPDWIIEPAMRNASVQPIDDAVYERKLSQISNDAGPDSDSMPTKRRTLNGNDDGKY
jgi:hypothetical protein